MRAASPGCERCGGHTARRGSRRRRQGLRCGAASRSAAAQGEPVHGGVVERRHVRGRDDLGGDGAAQRLEERHPLRSERPHVGEHQIDGLVQGDHRYASFVVGLSGRPRRGRLRRRRGAAARTRVAQARRSRRPRRPRSRAGRRSDTRWATGSARSPGRSRSRPPPRAAARVEPGFGPRARQRDEHGEEAELEEVAERCPTDDHAAWGVNPKIQPTGTTDTNRMTGAQTPASAVARARRPARASGRSPSRGAARARRSRRRRRPGPATGRPRARSGPRETPRGCASRGTRSAAGLASQLVFETAQREHDVGRERHHRDPRAGGAVEAHRRPALAAPWPPGRVRRYARCGPPRRASA